MTHMLDELSTLEEWEGSFQAKYPVVGKLLKETKGIFDGEVNNIADFLHSAENNTDKQ